MIILRNILVVIYLLVCIGLIFIATIQTRDSAGASGTITGSSTNNFYEKNKGRTKDGQLKRMTVYLSIAFAVLTIALGILFVVAK